MKKSILANPGYWFGGLFCFIAVLSLSLGIAPFIVSLRKNVLLLQIPGEQKLNLRLPGAYVAVCVEKNLSPQDKQRFQDIQYSLTGKDEDEIEIAKFPSQNYATGQVSEQIPLFQFIIEKSGEYHFNSSYSYDMAGPNLKAVLFHTDLGYVRMELIVGFGVFLVLGILGLYFIRQNYKSNERGQKIV